MKNLFEETMKVLNNNGKTMDDVISIQGDDFAITVENFIEIAKQTNYDSGYGSQEIARDLKIIGEDWWLERMEYDGSEWWEFKKIPQITKNIKEVYNLHSDSCGWMTLKEINK